MKMRNNNAIVHIYLHVLQLQFSGVECIIFRAYKYKTASGS